MRKRFLGGAIATVAALLIVVPGASAATEFGDSCIADESESGSYTVTTLSGSGGTLPLTAPVAGVVTKVKMTLPPIPFTIPVVAKVLRSAGGTSFTVIGDAPMAAGAGTTVADARIPVQVGDRLGLHGQPFQVEGSPTPGVALFCENPGSSLGATPGNPAPGQTAAFSEVEKAGVPLSAVIEPDADNDGYGDETQDLCPQSATAQLACPKIKLDLLGIVAGNAVKVLATTDFAGPVKVSGSVKLGKGSKAKLSAKKKAVSPGKFVVFKLKFPSKLKQRLGELGPNEKLTLKITAQATNVIGQKSTDKLSVKLKGT